MNRKTLLIVPVVLLLAQLAMPVAHAQITYPDGFEGIDAEGSGHIAAQRLTTTGPADLNIFLAETPTGGWRFDRIQLEVRPPGTEKDTPSELGFWWTIISVKETQGKLTFVAVPRYMGADPDDWQENLMGLSTIRVTISLSSSDIADAVGAPVKMVGASAWFNGNIAEIETEMGDT